MDSDQKCFLIAFCSVVVGIVLVVGIIFVGSCIYTKQFIDAGYTRATLVGSDYVQWVKK